jgi:hypothetical protein
VTGQYDGQQIYENFQKGPGPGELLGSAAIVREVAGQYRDLADRVHELAVEMEAAWEGDAGDGARRGARPMIAEHEMAAHELLTAEDLVTRQAGSFLEAKNRVVPVPPLPGEVEPWGPLSPTDTTSVLRQATAHLAAAQNNVDVMNGYTGASDHNTVHLPMTYGTLTSTGVTLGQAGSFLGGEDPQDRDGAGTGTSPSAVAPRAELDGRQGRPGLPGTAPAPGMVAPSGAGEVGTPVVTRRGTAGVPTAAAVSPAGRGTSPASAPPRSGAASPTTRAGETPAGAATRADAERATRGASPRTGTEPRVPPTARMVTETRAGAARPGSLGGVPAGAPRREEDTERRAPAFLEERDPEDLFGSDEVVAPETIGLDED